MERLSPGSRGNVGVEEPGAEDLFRFPGADVHARAPSGVIAVRVRDHGPVDGHPRVYVKVAGFAVEAAIGSAKEVGHDSQFSHQLQGKTQPT